MKYYLIFLFVMSAFTFILYLSDKIKAKKGSWRIKEATLLLCTLLGGSIGAFFGIYLLHHKSNFKRKFYFHIVLWLSLILQSVPFYFFLKSI